MPCQGGWTKTGLAGILPIHWEGNENLEMWLETNGRAVVAYPTNTGNQPFARWFERQPLITEDQGDELFRTLNLQDVEAKVATLASWGFHEVVPLD